MRICQSVCLILKRKIRTGRQVWKTGIRITLRGIAISVDYILNFRGVESDHGPGDVDGNVRVIGPAAPVMESGGNMYKYLRTH